MINSKKIKGCFVASLLVSSLVATYDVADLSAKSEIDVSSIEVNEDSSEDYYPSISANNIKFTGVSSFEDTDELDDSQDLPVLNLEVEEFSATMYVSNNVKVRSLPTSSESSLGSLSVAEAVTVTGKCGDWFRIAYNDTDGFISSKYLSSTKPSEYVYSGVGLTKSMGVNFGPSGKETYYNLPMNGVVNIMRRAGFSESTYPYWVREDGVKMLGNYVMVAANLNARPRGSLVPTSLGMGIVCDTGGFASTSSTWIDIATAW